MSGEDARPFELTLRVTDEWGQIVFEGETSTAKMKRSFDELVHWLTVDNPVPHGSIQEVLAGFDVLVVPSTWYENSPLTIHEARQCGVPVIASRLGGMEELVHDGVDGALFAPGDSVDLARVIRSLAAPFQPAYGSSCIGGCALQHFAKQPRAHVI